MDERDVWEHHVSQITHSSIFQLHGVLDIILDYAKCAVPLAYRVNYDRIRSIFHERCTHEDNRCHLRSLPKHSIAYLNGIEYIIAHGDSASAPRGLVRSHLMMDEHEEFVWLEPLDQTIDYVDIRPFGGSAYNIHSLVLTHGGWTILIVNVPSYHDSKFLWQQRYREWMKTGQKPEMIPNGFKLIDPATI